MAGLEHCTVAVRGLFFGTCVCGKEVEANFGGSRDERIEYTGTIATIGGALRWRLRRVPEGDHNEGSARSSAANRNHEAEGEKKKGGCRKRIKKKDTDWWQREKKTGQEKIWPSSERLAFLWK